MKVLTVVGARPQFIKAAVVARALADVGVEERLVHTGQHYDDGMSARFFRELGIPEPRYSLGVGSGTHGAQTGRMMMAIEPIVIDEAPDVMLVYGDTNSTLAGALVGAKLGVPVAHVEAGLRSFNRRMPEETNRVVADHVATLLFVPTPAGAANLRAEGIPASRIHEVGDVMLDAARRYTPPAAARAALLASQGVAEKGYVLATIHRAENTDDETTLRGIFEGLLAAAARVPVVIPLHPRTRRRLDEAGLLASVAAGLRCLEPLGYVEMLALTAGARLVATDSGGLQKEAYWCGTPCVTLRTETEWVELVDSGWNRLVPLEREAIAAAVAALPAPGRTPVPVHEESAAPRIANVLSRSITAGRWIAAPA